jgi:PAS domain-containing protein
MSNLPPTSSEFAYETAYAEALEAALAGQPALPSFFESWEADAWPPAADLIRLHTRLLQGRDDVAQERAASFLAEVLAQYDARYAALREDFASLERLTSVGTWKHDVRRQRLSWSDRALAELGMSREEVLTDPKQVIAHFVHPDDRERVAAALCPYRGGRGGTLPGVRACCIPRRGCAIGSAVAKRAAMPPGR